MSALMRYSTPVNTLSDWLENIFADNGFEYSNRQLMSGTWPKVDIVENDEHFSIHADLPGLSKKDVTIRIENGVLILEGEKKGEVRKEKDKYTHLERRYGKFTRTFTLPEGVDEDRIQAKMAEGVLELTLPKNEKARPKKLEIKIN